MGALVAFVRWTAICAIALAACVYFQHRGELRVVTVFVPRPEPPLPMLRVISGELVFEDKFIARVDDVERDDAPSLWIDVLEVSLETYAMGHPRTGKTVLVELDAASPILVGKILATAWRAGFRATMSLTAPIQPPQLPL